MKRRWMIFVGMIGMIAAFATPKSALAEPMAEQLKQCIAQAESDDNTINVERLYGAPYKFVGQKVSILGSVGSIVDASHWNLTFLVGPETASVLIIGDARNLERKQPMCVQGIVREPVHGESTSGGSGLWPVVQATVAGPGPNIFDLLDQDTKRMKEESSKPTQPPATEPPPIRQYADPPSAPGHSMDDTYARALEIEKENASKGVRDDIHVESLLPLPVCYSVHVVNGRIICEQTGETLRVPGDLAIPLDWKAHGGGSCRSRVDVEVVPKGTGRSGDRKKVISCVSAGILAHVRRELMTLGVKDDTASEGNATSR